MVKGHERYVQVKISCPIQTHGLVLMLLWLRGYHGRLELISVGWL
jgi:hypothetical protein